MRAESIISTIHPPSSSEEVIIVSEQGQPVMRSSSILQRGAKGYGWYTKFMKEGNAGFEKYIAPTPFDWNQKNENGEAPKRPQAFFDIRIENDKLDRIHFELASDVVPKTVDNFKQLCLGQGKKFGGYKGTKIHYTSKGVAIMAGDIVTETCSGTGNHSASESRYFQDENYIIPHSDKGLVSMASIGIHTNGSQFYMALSPMAHLNGRCVVFARIIKGQDSIAAIEKVFTFRGSPAREIVIANCGIIDEDGEVHDSADVSEENKQRERKFFKNHI